jgi:hypothetical protein
MQLEKASHWLTIIGNFGLLVGVVLVVLQINQNSDLTREQLEHSIWTDSLNYHLTMMGDNPAAAVAEAIENPAALSLEDSRVVDAYLLYWALLESRNILLQQRGMYIRPPKTFSPQDPDHDLDLRVLGNLYAKARFQEIGFGPDLSPKIKDLMSSLSGDETINQYRSVIERTKR